MCQSKAFEITYAVIHTDMFPLGDMAVISICVILQYIVMTDILCIVSKFALAFTLLIFGEFVIEQEIDDTKWNKTIFIRTRGHDVVSC